MTFAKTQTVKTIRMDKTFDFEPIKKKVMAATIVPKFSSLNAVDAETFTRGLGKMIIGAGNGIFDILFSRYGFSVTNEGGDYICTGDPETPLANGCVITTNPAPKIPREALETVIEWYRRITAKNDEEAQVNFYWNESKATTVIEDGVEYALKDIPGVHIWSDELFSYTPKQYNDKTLTEVAPEDEWYDVFLRKFGLYVETHSHNSMGAFASGTDIDNSGNDGFQLVFGQLDKPKASMYSWMTMNRVICLGMTESDLNHIVELHPDGQYTEDEHYEIPLDKLTFDETLFEKWNQQIIVRPKPVITPTTRGYAHQQFLNKLNKNAYSNHGYGYNTYEDVYDDDAFWGFASTSTGSSKRRHSYFAQPYSPKEEADVVANMFTEALADTMVHQLLAGSDIEFTYDDMADLLQAAFLAGYLAKKRGPYSLSDNTYEQLHASVDIAVQRLVQDIDVVDTNDDSTKDVDNQSNEA